MTQKNYAFSDLDSQLSKDKITEDDLLQFPGITIEEQRNSPRRASLTHELEDLSITPTDKPTIALNDTHRKRKSTIPSKQLFQKQRKSEEATLNYNFTKNPQFQFNLTHKIKKKPVKNGIFES